MTYRDLPTLNAVLNATSAVLLLTGWWLIRRGRRDAHRRAMLAALATSTLFLVSYLAYHFEVGSVRFTGQGPIRTVYFAILIGHTVLAAAIVPLVLVTLAPRPARPLRGAPRPRALHPPAVAVGVRVRASSSTGCCTGSRSPRYFPRTKWVWCRSPGGACGFRRGRPRGASAEPRT